MKNKELKAKLAGMKPSEIIKEMRESERKLSDLISDSVTGKIKNVREAKDLRHYVARLKTQLGQISSRNSELNQKVPL
jgi:ribosomal protein L29